MILQSRIKFLAAVIVLAALSIIAANVALAGKADQPLQADWLFQAGGMPTVWHIQEEIRWTRELADRLAARENAPDLSAELAELDKLQQPLTAPGDSTSTITLRYPQGLVARWNFDEADSKSFADASGNGRKGTLQGFGRTVPGVQGGALLLGGGGFLATDLKPADVIPDNYTVSAWINTTSSVMDLLGSGTSAGDLLMVVNQGPMRGHHWTDAGGNVLDGKRIVNDGRWHHVAQVVDQDSISIYVDGRLDVTARLQGTKPASAAALNLGTRSAASTGYRYRGCMDEVCLFDRALTARQIGAIHAQGQLLPGTHARPDPELYFAVRRVKRQIMFKDPLIDFTQVLFVDVPCYDALNHESMHRVFPQAQNNVGRLLVLDGLRPDGELRDLGPGPGMYWRPDLSFDAKKVLFCYRPREDRTFHLYEKNLDGSGLRQLTDGSYDDLDPIYMPDGHIIFLSNRGNSYARCAVGHPSYVVSRCDANGKNIYLISANNEPDYTPALMPDGRVLYTRWEYTDKELFRIQSLWTTNPNGTGTTTFWGNQSYWPDMLVEARPIPGSHRVMFSGQGHHDIIHGAIGIIDRNAGFNYPDGLTKVTVDRPWAEVGDGPDERVECEQYHASGNYVGYRCPFPLSEEVFLVSARPAESHENTLLGAYRQPDSRFALYLMDVYGNRELIYSGGNDILYAMPIRPRQKPPVLPDTVAWPGAESQGRPVKQGTLYSSNVLQGLDEKVRRVARYVRVIHLDYTTFTFGLKTQAPGRWGDRGATHMHAGPPLSITGNDGFKRILGSVPIEKDGSVYIEVPPNKQLHFQLLDEKYRAVHTMRSFTNLMPGERRGCVGCHELHSTAPPNYSAMALQKPPSVPTPPPWGPYYNLGYERDIQPILDRYCGDCHQNDGEARKDYDLTLRASKDGGTFPEPYVTLTMGAKRSLRDFPHNCEGGVAGTILPMAFPLPPEEDRTLPPMTALSYTSHLIDLASSGSHYDVRVDELSRRKLIAWVDILCPYLGEAEIRGMEDPHPEDPFYKNSPYPPRTPGVRPFAESPYPPRMKNAPIVNRAYSQDEFPTQAHRLPKLIGRTSD